ncbi:MAG: DUF1992 domain-containing protein [Deltaproteobacteria bacterium]|jgi:hypothetical protein|nr:DUF1992 domain-containing protein [Deltaproteobacteria bacterium]
MEDKINALALIAERKILEAMERGFFDNLGLAGKPLPEDDLANLPDDLRLAWRILRSAGYTDKSPGPGEALNLNGLLDDSPDENQTCRKLTRLKLRLDKKNQKAGPGAAKSEKASQTRGQARGETPVENPSAAKGGPDILESAYLEKLLQKIR